MKRLFIAAFALSTLWLQAQTSKRPDNWFNLDPATDKVQGISTEKTYKELLKDKTGTTVIVGVLDSGVDFDHEDLRDVMWTNPGEIPGNNKDDDGNGYVDDIHGWNFIGGRDGPLTTTCTVWRLRCSSSTSLSAMSRARFSWS